MAVKVKDVKEKDGIAVKVTVVSNEVVGTELVMGRDGKPTELLHSRFREDGKQVRTVCDLDIPPADYRKMFQVAGAILGRKRRKGV